MPTKQRVVRLITVLLFWTAWAIWFFIALTTGTLHAGLIMGAFACMSTWLSLNYIFAKKNFFLGPLADQ